MRHLAVLAFLRRGVSLSGGIHLLKVASAPRAPLALLEPVADDPAGPGLSAPRAADMLHRPQVGVAPAGKASSSRGRARLSGGPTRRSRRPGLVVHSRISGGASSPRRAVRKASDPPWTSRRTSRRKCWRAAIGGRWGQGAMFGPRLSTPLDVHSRRAAVDRGANPVAYSNIRPLGVELRSSSGNRKAGRGWPTATRTALASLSLGVRAASLARHSLWARGQAVPAAEAVPASLGPTSLGKGVLRSS
jgi:hypothetical protein